jgi:hypothetical protein
MAGLKNRDDSVRMPSSGRKNAKGKRGDPWLLFPTAGSCSEPGLRYCRPSDFVGCWSLPQSSQHLPLSAAPGLGIWSRWLPNTRLPYRDNWRTQKKGDLPGIYKPRFILDGPIAASAFIIFFLVKNIPNLDYVD